MPSDNRHNGGPPIDDENVFGRDGWIAIARAMRDHHLVGFGRVVEPADDSRGFVYSRAEAWIDLIMECRYEPGYINNNGRKMRLEPGQLMGATSWLGHRWNWSPKQVRSFLDKLEKDDMIERFLPAQDETNQSTSENQSESDVGRSKGRLSNIIMVCNYSKFQLSGREEGHVAGQVQGRFRAGSGQVQGHNLTKEQGNKETTHTQTGADATTPEAKPAQPANPPPVNPTPVQPVQPDTARPGEEPVGAGVFVNCETVRHRSFTLSIEAIAMQLATTNIGVSTTEARHIARTSAIAHALQWATEINAGKLSRDVVPSNPANFIRGSVVSQRSKAKQAGSSKIPSYLRAY